MSYADDIFDANIREILDSGISTENEKVRPHWADDGAPAYTLKKFGVVNRYDLSKEFPLLTLHNNCILFCHNNYLCQILL